MGEVSVVSKQEHLSLVLRAHVKSSLASGASQSVGSVRGSESKNYGWMDQASHPSPQDEEAEHAPNPLELGFQSVWM